MAPDTGKRNIFRRVRGTHSERASLQRGSKHLVNLLNSRRRLFRPDVFTRHSGLVAALVLMLALYATSLMADERPASFETSTCEGKRSS